MTRRAAAATVTAAVLVMITVAVVVAVRAHLLDQILVPETGAAVGFALVGAFLVYRRPVTWIATIMCAAGLSLAAEILTGVLAQAAVAPGPLHGAALWVAWLAQFLWVPGVAAVVPLTLLFPDGRLAHPGWRWPVVVTGALCLGYAALFGTARGDLLDGAPAGWSPNPTGVVAFDPVLFDDLNLGMFFGLGVLMFVSLGALIVRRRRAAGIERAQLTCLLFGAALTVLAVFLGNLLPERVLWAELVAVIGFVPLPLAVAVAVLRYKLYEIDRIVSRTVTYAVVSGLLLGVYVGIIAGLSALLPTNANSLVVAAATLAVASLFIPVRRRVQGRVDRRFNRARYNRTVLVEQFAEQLRRDVTHGSGGGDLVDVVHRALEPAHASVWLVANGVAR